MATGRSGLLWTAALGQLRELLWLPKPALPPRQLAPPRRAALPLLRWLLQRQSRPALQRPRQQTARQQGWAVPAPARRAGSARLQTVSPTQELVEPALAAQGLGRSTRARTGEDRTVLQALLHVRSSARRREPAPLPSVSTCWTGVPPAPRSDPTGRASAAWRRRRRADRRPTAAGPSAGSGRSFAATPKSVTECVGR
jgi:hypothetical protein